MAIAKNIKDKALRETIEEIVSEYAYEYYLEGESKDELNACVNQILGAIDEYTKI